MRVVIAPSVGTRERAESTGIDGHLDLIRVMTRVLPIIAQPKPYLAQP